MLRAALFALSICLLATSQAVAQKWAEDMFETTDHDFGMVARGSKAEVQFRFKNIYKEDAHVQSVRSSCGCTTASVTQSDLKTYDESAIVAKFNTVTHLGQGTATVTVVFDKPFYAEVQLHVKGYTRTDVVLHPPSVQFGTIDQGQTAEKRIVVDYAGRDDWTIVEAKSANAYVEANVEETSRTGGRASYELVVRLKEDAPNGYIKDQLFLTTNDRRTKQIPVMIEGKVTSAVSVSPGSLFMGVVEPGQKVTKQLVVKARRPFRILSVECDDDCFKFQPSDAQRAVHLVPVTFTAGDHPGKIQNKIRIQIDIGGESSAAEALAYAQVLDTSDGG